MREGVGDRTELQHIDPHSYGHQCFFPIHLGCSTGGLGSSLSGCWFSLPHLISNSDPQLLNRGPEGSLCWVLAFSTTSCLQLVWSPTDWISCALSYIIIQRPPSCECHNFTLIQPIHGQGYNPDIPRSDATVIYTGVFPILTARLGHRSIYNTYTFWLLIFVYVLCLLTTFFFLFSYAGWWNSFQE